MNARHAEAKRADEARTDQDSASPLPACIARQIFSAVSGVSRWRTPKLDSASTTALANAAGGGTVETEPMPLAPRGLVGEGVSSVSRITVGNVRGLGDGIIQQTAGQRLALLAVDHAFAQGLADSLGNAAEDLPLD